jgi:predicted NBD/HSP70 family sugar kinase
MRAALDHGPIARSTVARIAGLSPAAVSRQCAELIRRGLLREIPDPHPPAGRPHIPVDIDTEQAVVCGAHIALRHTTLAVLDLRGRVLARDRIPHPAARDPVRVLDQVAAALPPFLASTAMASTAMASTAMARAGRHRVAGIGVATGGWVDSGAGVIAGHPLLGWHDIPVRDQLEQLTGLPVRVDGHARAMVRAEELFGDQRARSSAVHLFAGNVVDAAFAVGGSVHHGPRSAAGAVAHLTVPGRTDPCECGAAGCLQAVASDGALTAQAAAAGIGPAGTAPVSPLANPLVSPLAALLTAARAGDTRAMDLFRRRAQAIGAAVATLLGMLNPGVFIVAEAGVMHLPGCLDALRAEVRVRCPHWPWDDSPEPPVIASSFGDDVLAVAAGTVMLAEIYADPSTI